MATRPDSSNFWLRNFSFLFAAIGHGPSGKNQTLKLPTVITSVLKKYVQRSFCMEYWNYINDLISPHNEDGKHQGQKRFWIYIQSLKQDYSGVSSLKYNGKLVTDSFGKAEVLNTQFQSVFT